MRAARYCPPRTTTPRPHLQAQAPGDARHRRMAGVALVHAYARISMIIRCSAIPPEAYGQAPEPIPRRPCRVWIPIRGSEFRSRGAQNTALCAAAAPSFVRGLGAWLLAL